MEEENEESETAMEVDENAARLFVPAIPLPLQKHENVFDDEEDNDDSVGEVSIDENFLANDDYLHREVRGSTEESEY